MEFVFLIWRREFAGPQVRAHIGDTAVTGGLLGQFSVCSVCYKCARKIQVEQTGTALLSLMKSGDLNVEVVIR